VAEPSRGPNQGCQIFLGTLYQNGENIPNDNKNIPNGHEISQMPVNISNGNKIYQHFPI
jgi:hypothetical protein